MSAIFQDFYSVSREERGKKLIETGLTPFETQENVWLMHSQFNDNKYKVIQNWNGWICTCPDYHYRKVQCKHIFGVRYWLDLKTYLNKEGMFEALEEMYQKPSCVHCSSFKIIKHGVRQNKGMKKQRFFCTNCEKTFIANNEFNGYKGDAQTVTLAMDLYFKGLSLRKIQDTLKQFYGLKISHETVRLWINYFMQQINDYTAKFVPTTSRQWNADEMKIKAGGKWVWAWNVLDKETRFLLATNVTKGRYTKDAQTVFQEAKNVTPFQPQAITTDGLQSYKHAVEKEFRTLKNRNTQHFFKAGIAGRTNNNRIERLHGSIRERLKVQRGHQNQKTSLRQMENWRTYYNFLRPHMALNGKTPAEASNVKIPHYKTNKWHSLITKAKNH